jgi:uncharacterized protein YbgA (DUF1722 family)/uncharacterized protein YbbK (DUF523 family)
MNDLIKLGISTCLLGENVRYDGGHKLDRYLTNVVGPFVDWVPVCPEVECGLSVPREAMRLVGHPDNPRLVTVRSTVDHTERMQSWIQRRLVELESKDLCGFIFKARSPSSGMRGVKVYTEAGQPSHRGVGMFARAFMERFPDVPVEDEGRLHDAGLRENFIERVFTFHRWKILTKKGKTVKNLVDFHTDHKLLLMSHSPKLLRELGRIVALAKGRNPRLLFSEYATTMIDTLKLKATVKKNVNVLFHMVGYFKRVLSPDEKQELLEIIEHYHQEMTPLIVPITLFNHYVRKYSEHYLKRQVYLNPHPIELMLRNRV